MKTRLSQLKATLLDKKKYVDIYNKYPVINIDFDFVDIKQFEKQLLALNDTDQTFLDQFDLKDRGLKQLVQFVTNDVLMQINDEDEFIKFVKQQSCQFLYFKDWKLSPNAQAFNQWLIYISRRDWKNCEDGKFETIIMAPELALSITREPFVSQDGLVFNVNINNRFLFLTITNNYLSDAWIPLVDNEGKIICDQVQIKQVVNGYNIFKFENMFATVTNEQANDYRTILLNKLKTSKNDLIAIKQLNPQVCKALIFKSQPISNGLWKLNQPLKKLLSDHNQCFKINDRYFFYNPKVLLNLLAPVQQKVDQDFDQSKISEQIYQQLFVNEIIVYLWKWLNHPRIKTDFRWDETQKVLFFQTKSGLIKKTIAFKFVRFSEPFYEIEEKQDCEKSIKQALKHLNLDWDLTRIILIGQNGRNWQTGNWLGINGLTLTNDD